MSALTQFPYRIGRGRLHRVAALPQNPTSLAMGIGAFVGNCEALTLTPKTEDFEAPDYTGDGLAQDDGVIQGVDVSITLLCFGGSNLATHLMGAAVATSTGTKSETFDTDGVSVAAESMLFVASAIDPEEAVTVVPSWTTWTENVHWARNGAFGIRLLTNFSGPSESYITVGYTGDGTGQRVETLQAARIETGLVYVGSNLANSANGMVERISLYRAALKPPEKLDVITGSGYDKWTVNGKLRAVRLNGVGKPRWAAIERIGG